MLFTIYTRQIAGPALLFICLISGCSAYTWPNPQIDFLEALLYEQSNGVSPAVGVGNCSADINFDVSPTKGRTAAAEWLRTAYHDMATADVVAGTGGIDASIGFEFANRDENKGLAFAESLRFFTPFHSVRSSMADLIALGAVLSVGSCSNGMLTIPFRVGRVDATGPGKSGVPEPQQNLTSHTASFVRQGFNVTEMIGLVACGHTIGGVHGNDFPEIVPVVKNKVRS
jgi:catalase (peroxidase I)